MTFRFCDLFFLLLLIIGAGRLGAHSGHGSDMQVRVFDDKMRIVLRTSMQLAWARLGNQAPLRADEAGQQAALPLLIAAATGMVSVYAGGNAMKPRESNVVFEVGDHVAFVLVFPRPVEWPVVLNAHYVTTLGNLDVGTVAVFDQSGSRFVSEMEPFVRKELHAVDTRLEFSLPARVVAPAVEAKSTNASVVSEPPREETPASLRPFVWILYLLPALVAGWLLRRFASKRGSSI